MEDFFAALAAEPEWNIQVLYEMMAVRETHWGNRTLPEYARLIGGESVTHSTRILTYNRGIRRELKTVDADLYVVQGYSSLTDQDAMRWLTHHRKKWVFWGERPGFRPRGILGRWLRQQAMRAFLDHADAIVGIGRSAVQQYQSLLTREIPVMNIPYHCDLKSFQEAARRKARPIPPDDRPLTILYCGQLIPRKGLDTLMHAFNNLIEAGHNLRLRLVGTGPAENSLRKQLHDRARLSVEFSGFHPVEDLPELFAESDLFVLPSRYDGWGVVVNQALGAGLPVICSDRVGAADDLIEEDRNGYRFPVGDVQTLSNKLSMLIHNPEKLREMSEHSLALAQQWTPQRGVSRWKSLIHQLAQTRTTPAQTATAPFN